jgi:ribosomal protein S18 acetylase RimI-like enzyme
MKIIKANLISHAQLFYDMDVKTFTRDFDYPARNVADESEYLANSEIYLAYVSEVPIGFIAYEAQPNQIEIKTVVVLPKYQGKGYGKKMIIYLINLVKSQTIFLVTHPFNTPALIAYLKSGFKIQGWQDNYYGDGQPRLLLRFEKL